MSIMTYITKLSFANMQRPDKL